MKKIATMALTIACLAAALPAQAEFPKNWYLEGVDDFLAGQAVTTSIQSDGSVSLTSDLQRLTRLNSDTIFDAYMDGNTLYLGTGNKAAVYAYSLGQSGEPKQIFQWNQGIVSALTKDKSGALYAALAPHAQIFKSDGSGKLQPFANLKERYIWDMLDTPKGFFLVTGGSGALYQMQGNRPELMFKASESNLKTLVYDPQWGVVFGSGSQGLIYQYQGKNKARVLVDTPFKEITSLISDGKGNLYFAGVTDKPGKKQAKSGVYVLNKQGQSEVVFKLYSETAHSLALDKNGDLFVGTGRRGRVYKITGPLHSDKRDISYPGHIKSRDVSQMIALPNNDLIMVGAKPSVIERFKGSFLTKGVYMTEIFKAGMPSRWGALNYKALAPGGTRVVAFSRSGNTPRPDKTWSDWQGPYTNPVGSQIQSPKGKYLQLKFELQTNNPKVSPKLHSFNISYLRDNLPPQVHEVFLLEPGIYFTPHSMGKLKGPRTVVLNYRTLSKMRKPRSTEDMYYEYELDRNPPMRMAQQFKKGMLSLGWDATDANEDILSYDIHYQTFGSNQWKVLAKDIRNIAYSFDSTALKDGIYHFRVYAKDKISNMDGGYQVFRDSELITIDNTMPTASSIGHQVTDKEVIFRFSVKDETSALAFAEYSLDGQEYQLMTSKDMIVDNQSESFEVRIPRPAQGGHTIAFKITDQMQNTLTVQKPFQVN